MYLYLSIDTLITEAIYMKLGMEVTGLCEIERVSSSPLSIP